ncbi:pseudouridylate synthase [Angomonas deanei]|nr:pseudouridylate synthase [Angomonas deanei]|eukprot:EPY26456.1 pseudouridylate synthase [Angomonas deanei]
MSTSPNDAFSLIYANTKMLVLNKPHDVAMDTPNEKKTTTTGGAPESVVVPSTDVEKPTVESWCLQHLSQVGLLDVTQCALQKEGKMKKQVKFVHQLDYATSGVLVVGLDKRASATLSFCFQSRKNCCKMYSAYLLGHLTESAAVERYAANRSPITFRGVMDDFTAEALAGVTRGVYVCPILQEGPNPPFTFFSHIPTSEEGTLYTDDTEREETTSCESNTVLSICLPITHDDEDAFKMKVCEAEGGGPVGRAALTHLQVVNRGYIHLPDQEKAVPVTLVRLYPRTGRRHQLRVHCAALGHPILGDVCYTTASLFPEVDTAAFPRMYLHAERLRLPVDVVQLEHSSKEETDRARKRRRRLVKGIEVSEDDDDHCRFSEFIAKRNNFPPMVPQEG